MKKSTFSFVLTVLLLLTMQTTAWADYIHGYFRYTVKDHSVTITAYDGREDTVTVPAMIGGNPVNTIAAGAFAHADSVKKVCLPDTIVSVEEGAFASGQEVVYAKSEGTPPSQQEESQENTKQDNDGSTKNDNSSETPIVGPTESPSGITMEDGTLITVDDGGNLIQVYPDGSERVIDDTQTYTVKKNKDGKAEIRNKNKQKVKVKNGEVTYTNNNGKQVTVSTTGSSTTISDEHSEAAIEEADISTPEDMVAPAGEQEAESDHSIPAHQEPQTDASAPKENDKSNNGAVWIAVPVILAALAIVILFWWRNRRGG